MIKDNIEGLRKIDFPPHIVDSEHSDSNNQNYEPSNPSDLGDVQDGNTRKIQNLPKLQ